MHLIDTSKRVVRSGVNLMPRRLAGILARRFSRLVPYLDGRDVPVRISNPYYGSVCLRLSTKYRIEGELLYNGAFDEKSLLYFMRLLGSGDVCLDIGANIGALTLSMAHRVGPSGRVIAFEPGPLLFNRLLENLSFSHIRNVEAHQFGLSDESGMLYWRLETGDNSGNAMLSARDGEVVVRVERLDDCASVTSLTRLDFIKIDVEGMELQVITGGLKTIQRHLPTMLMETLLTGRPEDDQKIELLLDTLSNLGYESWEIDVPEKDLLRYSPKFRFIRCKYPRLPQNTLCLHWSRRSQLLGGEMGGGRN